MIENPKSGLLIIYDYFYPAYKAGGPIQSLTNLVLSLQDEYSISVITSNHDLNDDRILTNIESNSWSKLQLPGAAYSIDIWYAGHGTLNIPVIKKLVKQANPSTIYLNGMFSYRFVLLPLLSIKNLKIVICPRGMLQVGALAGKSLKKKIYLSLLKKSGLMNKVVWHTTNKDEQIDISRELGKQSKVIIAGNIPKKPLENITIPEKLSGQLKLVYLSLISEKKNLLQLINIISVIKKNISLDIYGPVKDESYFKKCAEIIKKNAHRIAYKGDVLPEQVQETFSKYHASILLTKGENFGHALYESLSAGRPVITSNFTAWNGLAEKKAGWNVDISNDQEVMMLISKVCDLDQSAYNEYYKGAFEEANNYYQNGLEIAGYRKLFT